MELFTITIRLEIVIEKSIKYDSEQRMYKIVLLNIDLIF